MIKDKKSELSKKILTAVILGGFALLCFIPIISVISISLSNQQDIVSFGYKLIPTNIDLTAYKYILKSPEQVLNAYKVTSIVTIVGTLFSLSVISLIAYPLSRMDFRYRKIISFLVFLHCFLMQEWYHCT